MPWSSSVTSKARMKCHGLVVLQSYGVDQCGLLRVYTGSIRPILCNAVPAWYPYVTDFQKDKLNSVQRVLPGSNTS